MEVDPTETDRDNPFEPVDPGDDDDEGEMIPMTSTSRRDMRQHGYDNPNYEETSFIDENTPLIRREERRDEAWERVKRKYPKVNPANSSFTSDIDEYDRVVVRMKRKGGRSYPLFRSDGELNDKLPKTIKESLGPTFEEVIETDERGITRRREKEKELESSLKDAGPSQRENIVRDIEQQRDERENMEREVEVIEERLSLRDRVKVIFKKYGFTAFAVLSAVGAVIGVIVSNLKSGLSRLGKGLSKGFKAIGKKLGEILPGMIGAIASFIFKTAGEAIGFLAKSPSLSTSLSRLKIRIRESKWRVTERYTLSCRPKPVKTSD